MNERTPKFCPECGAPTVEGDRFCGGCGHAFDGPVNDPPAESEGPSKSEAGGPIAGRAALLFGGWWTLTHRSQGRGTVWLARLASVLMAPCLGFVLLWWGAFLVGKRHRLAELDLEVGSILLAVSSVVALAAAIPLARRVAAAPRSEDDAAQRRQARFGAGIHALALALGLVCWAGNRAIADSVARAKAEARAAAEQRALFDELDRQFPPGTTNAERHGRVPRSGGR